MLEKLLAQNVIDGVADRHTLTRLKKPIRTDRQPPSVIRAETTLRLSFYFDDESYHTEFPWDYKPHELANALRHLAGVIDDDLKEKGKRTRELPKDES